MLSTQSVNFLNTSNPIFDKYTNDILPILFEYLSAIQIKKKHFKHFHQTPPIPIPCSGHLGR
jgi:hypothetical protein